MFFLEYPIMICGINFDIVGVDKMRAIAIITARGGSKRIPKKNIKSFCGQPIMVYSIKAALESNLYDVVMVSTDSEEIAEIAIAAGATVPFMRSEKTSDDYATTADVIIEVLRNYELLGECFDYATCIYATAPFVTAKKLQDAMRLIQEKSGKLLMPIVKFSFPPQRGMVFEGETIKPKWPENVNKRSQDLEPIYHDCGQFYCYKVNEYLLQEGQIKDGIIPMEMSEMEVQDIDTMIDWELAEVKYKLMMRLPIK